MLLRDYANENFRHYGPESPTTVQFLCHPLCPSHRTCKEPIYFNVSDHVLCTQLSSRTYPDPHIVLISLPQTAGSPRFKTDRLNQIPSLPGG